MGKPLLALDQSTDCTGWALFVDGQLIDYGHIQPPGEYLERIVQLRAWVLFNINKYDNNISFAIEDIQLQPKAEGKNYSQDSNPLTFKKLAHAQGVLLELFTELKINYSVVLSTEWKSTCGVKGANRSVQKKNALKFVEDTFNIKCTQDEADAICIGYHINNKASIKEFNWDD